MLELIFQGLIEWIYGLILEAWEHFASSLLDLMSMDFAYLEEHIPIIPTIRQALLAIGWALLLGNLVFQAAKSMLSGLGFEGEDPKLLFTRTFVFAFLLLASPQICDLCLNMTEKMIEVLRMPTAVHISFADESTFAGLAGAWLLVVICGIIVMFKSFKLIIEMAERYFILAMLTISAPLAFSTGGSRQTSDIFSGWCRMYGSMCLLMVLNVVFVKLLLSVLSYVPSGLDVLPWMVLVLTVVKVAKKADAIVTRIGLNPAMTGDSLGRRSFPGMLTYMVARTMISNAARSLGSGSGKNGSTGGSGSKKPNTPPGGSGAGGKSPHSGGNGPQMGGSRSGAANNRAGQGGAYSQHSTSRSNAQESTSQQESQSQNNAAQYGGQQNSFSDQQNTANHVAGNPAFSGDNKGMAGKQTRSTSVPSGAHQAPGHTKPPSGSAGGRNNTAAPTQAAVRPADKGSKNPQAGTAGKNAGNPSAAATVGKQSAYSAPGMAGKRTENTHRESATRETTAASRSGTAGTDRPAVPRMAAVTGTETSMRDHGTAGKAIEASQGQNVQSRTENTARSGMAGNTNAGSERKGVAGKTPAPPVSFGNTSRSGGKGQKNYPSVQKNTLQNGTAGTENETRRSSAPSKTDTPQNSGIAGTVNAVGLAGNAASVPPVGNTAKTGGNSYQKSTAVGRSEQVRSGMAGTARAQAGDSGSNSRSAAVPFGMAGNTRPETDKSPRSNAPGQSYTGIGSKAESGTGGAIPAAEHRSDGTAGSRQGPVNNTILAREQNHISVNQNTTGASAPGDIVISPSSGSQVKDQPNRGSTRSTHRPPAEKPVQRPGEAATTARPTETMKGKQTQLSGHGTAGSASANARAANRSTNAPRGDRPLSAPESQRSVAQAPVTARQEHAETSAENRSTNRAQPAFRKNETAAPVHGGPVAAIRNGMAGKNTLERAAAPNNAARQTSLSQSMRSSSVPGTSAQSGGKKTASAATAANQRFSGKGVRNTKRKPRKAGGKKHGKQ